MTPPGQTTNPGLHKGEDHPHHTHPPHPGSSLRSRLQLPSLTHGKEQKHRQ